MLAYKRPGGYRYRLRGDLTVNGIITTCCFAGVRDKLVLERYIKENDTNPCIIPQVTIRDCRHVELKNLTVRGCVEGKKKFACCVLDTDYVYMSGINIFNASSDNRLNSVLEIINSKVFTDDGDSCVGYNAQAATDENMPKYYVIAENGAVVKGVLKVYNNSLVPDWSIKLDEFRFTGANNIASRLNGRMGLDGLFISGYFRTSDSFSAGSTLFTLPKTKQKLTSNAENGIRYYPLSAVTTNGTSYLLRYDTDYNTIITESLIPSGVNIHVNGVVNIDEVDLKEDEPSDSDTYIELSGG